MRWILALLVALVLAGSCTDTLQIGDACLNDGQCPGTRVNAGVCALNFPGGYCSRPCSADTDCDSGSMCAPDVASCVKICSDTRQCRVSEGYSCTGTGTGGRKY